jgi:hypothetical protein
VIVKDKFDVQEKGSEIHVKQEIVTNNMDLMQFAAMMRAIPEDQRKGFWKKCRVKAIVPMYLPTGMYKENEHFGHLINDPDKMDYFLREAPEFRTVADPLAPGPKLTVVGKA